MDAQGLHHPDDDRLHGKVALELAPDRHGLPSALEDAKLHPPSKER